MTVDEAWNVSPLVHPACSGTMVIFPVSFRVNMCVAEASTGWWGVFLRLIEMSFTHRTAYSFQVDDSEAFEYSELCSHHHSGF